MSVCRMNEALETAQAKAIQDINEKAHTPLIHGVLDQINGGRLTDLNNCNNVEKIAKGISEDAKDVVKMGPETNTSLAHRGSAHLELTNIFEKK